MVTPPLTNHREGGERGWTTQGVERVARPADVGGRIEGHLPVMRGPPQRDVVGDGDAALLQRFADQSQRLDQTLPSAGPADAYLWALGQRPDP